jgi:hypothetical protein
LPVPLLFSKNAEKLPEKWAYNKYKVANIIDFFRRPEVQYRHVSEGSFIITEKVNSFHPRKGPLRRIYGY